MEAAELKSIVESLIFVSEEPITERALLEVLAEAGVTGEELSCAVDAIRNEANENTSRGLKLVEIAGGYQFRTKESTSVWIQKLNVPKPVRLSQPSLETLAIIAYRQPIVRSEIEQIRGVDVGATLKTLLERNLIRIIGRKDEPGTPLIYGTSHEFLETFNLKNLHELPTLTDIEELARRQVETETPKTLTIVKSDDEDETEVVENEGEDDEETEVIKKEEDEDEDELLKLEQGLKDLRRLEREIFPRPQQPAEDQNATGQEGQGTEQQAAPESADKPADAPPETDSVNN